MKCLLRSAFIVVIIAYLPSSFASSSSLYSKDDPLWELNARNYQKIIYGKSNAWIIEFYNSWCGHCIRFAPTWKQLARDTQTWKNMIDVAVVNCNDKENVKLCRQYDIQVFPTIKLFWHHLNESELGELFTSNRDIPSMESAMIHFLETRWKEGVPSNWADLQPIQVKDSESLIDLIPEDKKAVYIFVEHSDSFVGRKVILDLSFQKDHVIRRLLSSNELLHELKSVKSNHSIPALIKFDRTANEELLIKFSKDANETYIRDKVFEKLTGKHRNKTKIEIHEKEIPTNITVINHVYMTDLENAVYYSLSQEVGVSKYIQGEKISALKAYLSILKTYFPGSTPVMGYLSNLYNWVSYKKHSIDGGEFVQAMEQLQGEEEYFPRMREWVGCKGSEQRYRGYPCSLWTLFHTLTVQANKKLKEAEEQGMDDSLDTGDVLFIIRDYIKYFFTCEECARNFLEMAINIEEDVKSSEDAMLWLWIKHNNVNKRLSGDLTEDPSHPKVQFPSLAACPTCRRQDGSAEDVDWEKSEVVKYLQQFYDKEKIRISEEVRDTFTANENLRLSDASMDNHIKRKFSEKKPSRFLIKKRKLGRFSNDI